MKSKALGLGCLFVFFSLLNFALASDHQVDTGADKDTGPKWDESNVITHKILRGKLHKSGRIKLSWTPREEGKVMAHIRYKIRPKILVPLPKKDRQGQIDQLLPEDMTVEDGYMNLRDQKIMKHEKATMTFLGMEDAEGFSDCYKVLVKPHDNEWQGIFYYHPTVASLGFVKVELTIRDLPIVGDYTAISVLNE
ncbi:MAG: hypothetical protein ACPGJV_01620 [Bacteriovoracaceae bacterium]